MRTKTKGFPKGSLFYIPTKFSSVSLCTITSKVLFVILCGLCGNGFAQDKPQRAQVFRKELKKYLLSIT